MKQSMIFIPSTKRAWSLALLFLLYLASGINHFINPAFYYPLIPAYLGHQHLLVILSGVAEILLALLLLIPTTKKWAAWGIIAMLLAFLPAHILHVQQGGCIDPATLCTPAWVAWVRLLVLHPMLIYWAWVHARR
jgi:uncharacterized membrane protein